MNIDNFSKNELLEIMNKIVSRIGQHLNDGDLDDIEFSETTEIGSNNNQSVLISTCDKSEDQHRTQIRHDLVSKFFDYGHRSTARYRRYNQIMRSMSDKDISYDFVINTLQLIRFQNNVADILNNWFTFLYEGKND